jgi:hypothetical protein
MDLCSTDFLYKKLRVGACTFEFNTEGFKRTSRGHEMKVQWSEVAAVHQLSQAYVIELEEGAIPVPYRVFSLQERASFEALAKSAIGICAP